MKHLKKNLISSKTVEALSEFKNKLLAKFEVEYIILFGSVARRESDRESDIDLLIVTTHPLTRFKRHEITDIAFDINLRYGTNFSTLVVDHQSWENGIFSLLPLHEEIIKDGIIV